MEREYRRLGERIRRTSEVRITRGLGTYAGLPIMALECREPIDPLIVREFFHEMEFSLMVRTGLWEFRSITCRVPERLTCLEGEARLAIWLGVLRTRDREQEELFAAMKNLIAIDEGEDFARRFWHEFVVGMTVHRAGDDPDPFRNPERTLTFHNATFAPYYGTTVATGEFILTETCLPALKDLGSEMACVDDGGNPVRMSAAEAIGATSEREEVDREIDSLIAKADRAFDELFGAFTPSFA